MLDDLDALQDSGYDDGTRPSTLNPKNNAALVMLSIATVTLEP